MRNQKQMKQNLKITSISANSLFVRCIQMTLGWKQQPCSFARDMAVPHAEHCKVSSTIRVKEISGSAWDQRPILNKGGKFKCHITPTWSFQSRKCIDLWNTLWKLMIHQLKLFWTEQNHKQAPLCHICICFSVFSRGITWKSKATVTLGETVVGDCSDHVKSTCQDSNKMAIRVRLLSVLGIKLAATCIRQSMCVSLFDGAAELWSWAQTDGIFRSLQSAFINWMAVNCKPWDWLQPVQLDWDKLLHTGWPKLVEGGVAKLLGDQLVAAATCNWSQTAKNIECNHSPTTFFLPG